MPRILFCVALVMCGCTLFERAPVLQSSDMSNADSDVSVSDVGMTQDVGSDLVSQPDADMGSTECGNDVQEVGEACDGSVLMTCRGRGYDGGDLSCSDVCTIDESECWRCDYYVDSQAGDDTNDGLSDAGAFGTLEPIRTMLEGNNLAGATWRICLKRGSAFNLTRSIELRVTGSDSRNPLTNTSYGDPNDPLPIDSATRQVTPVPSTVYTGGNAYEIDNQGGDVTMVWEKTEDRFHIFNPVLVVNQPGLGSILVENDATHYIPNAGTPDPNTQILTPAFKIPDDPMVTSIGNYVIENIRFEEVSQALVFLSSFANVDNVTIRGVEVVNAQQGVAIGNLDQTTVRDILVEDSLFSHNWIGVAITLESLAPAPITIRRNRFEDYNTTSYLFGISAGVTVFGAADPIIVDNQFHGKSAFGENGVMVIDFFGTGLLSAPVVERNFFSNLATGFNLSSAHRDTRFVNNVVANAGIGFAASTTATNSLCAHNTFVGTTNVSMSVTASNWELVNNYSEIEGNANHIVVNSGTVLDSRNNAFVPTGANQVFQVTSVGRFTFAEWKGDPYFQDLNSISPSVSAIETSPPVEIEDFAPRGGGLLFDAGEFLPSVVDDYFSNPRPTDPNDLTATPDIGAIEL